jgi:hypothetical protein
VKVAAIHQPQYLPYLGFFHKIAHADVFVMLDDVQFQKNGLQNRNKIKSAQGWQWLTVPVEHDHDTKIQDVRVREPRWGRKHWNALQSNYGRAPHFTWAADALRPVFERAWTHLCPLNTELTARVCELLGITTPRVFSSELSAEGEASERLASLCKAIGADAYLSGPGGRQYMDLQVFERAKIQVLWQEFVPPTYPQTFPDAGFVENLSVVDALFDCGEQARAFVAR